MKELEISVIKLSELNIRNDRFRLDSEFVRKEYLSFSTKLESKKYLRLTDTNSRIIHPTEIKRIYENDGIWFFRAQNLRPLKIEKSNDVFVSKEDARLLIKNEIKYNDILMTRTGANYGQTAIFNIDEKAICSSHVLIIRNTSFNQSYLAVFFNTLFGRKMIDKGMYGAAQPEISPYYILNIPIPIFSDIFQKIIENLIDESSNLTRNSINKYCNAESLLLEIVNLKNFKPNSDPINIRNLKDSFLTTGRLDSEYYQKKYEDYEKSIIFNSMGYTLVSNEYSLVKKVSEKEKPYYNYIEIGDINISDGSASYNLIETSELPANAKTEIKKGDILISKVRSNRGAVAIVDFEVENLIVSGAFTVLREKNSSIFSNETLKVLLRTEIYKDWLLKFNIGTQYPVIRDEDILNMPIPKIPKEVQEIITYQIKESQELKKQSQHLLDTAKRAVEIAIEQNEDVAINFINKNI